MSRTLAAAATGLPVPCSDPHAGSRELAAIVAAAAQPTPEHADAELLALAATIDRLQAKLAPLRAAVDRPDSTDEDAEVYDAVDDVHHEALKKLAGLRATTLAGFQAIARALSYCHPYGFTAEKLLLSRTTTDHRLVWAILSALAPPAPVAGALLPEAQRHPEHPDAALLGLGRRWLAVRQECKQVDLGPGVPDEECNALVEREARLMEAIGALPAQTFAGLGVKARILIRSVCNDGYDDVDFAALVEDQDREHTFIGGAVSALVRDLLRLAQEQPR